MSSIIKYVVVGALLLSITYFTHASTRNSADHQVGSGTELDLLLKIAREYRDGSPDVPKNLDRAVHFFQYVLEQSNELSKTTIAAGKDLYNLLLSRPQLKSKYTKWQLLTMIAEYGDGQAQHDLATALGSGVFVDGLVPMDAAKALLLEYSSALSGHAVANMAMGYRFLHGIGVLQSCDRALPHYEFAANLAAEYLEKQVIQPNIERFRPSDLAATSLRASGAGRSYIMSRQELSSELADYYAHLADSGDVAAANILGSFYLYGSRNFPPNHQRAIHFLNLAAKLQHAPAAGMLGYFLIKSYVKENAMEQGGNYSLAHQFPYTKIIELLRVAEKKGDVYGIMGIGVIHEYGIGVERNLTKSLEMYNKCLHVHSDAGFFAGEIRLRYIQQTKSSEKGNSRTYDVVAGTHAYSASSALGNVLASHRLGHISARGIGTTRSCENAVQAFKTVAERGPWMTQLSQAYTTYRQRGSASTSSAAASSVSSTSSEAAILQALWKLVSLGVAGVENAQFLSAYLLTQHAEDLPAMDPTPGISEAWANQLEAYSTYNLSEVAAVSTAEWMQSLRLPRILIAEHHEASQQDSSPATVSATGNTRSHTADYAKKVVKLGEDMRRALSAYLHGQQSWTQLTGQWLTISTASSTTATNNNALAEARYLSEIRALSLLGLSASQGNSDAFLMLGDFHYYGSAALSAAPSRAVTFYQRAADLHHTQAIFNLGVMYEVGDGVTQDFHLAKRFYDMAAEVDVKARLPRDMALMVMEIHRQLVRQIGDDNSIWQYVDWSTVEILRVYASEGVRWLDFFSSELLEYYERCTGSWQQMSEEAIAQSVPAKQRFLLRHYVEKCMDMALETVRIMVKAVKLVEKFGKVKAIVMEQDEIMMLAGLSLLFLSLILTKMLVRARERQMLLQRPNQ